MNHKFPCPKCGAGDIKISPVPISGPDLGTASYGFTKYNYICNSCGSSGYHWVDPS